MKNYRTKAYRNVHRRWETGSIHLIVAVSTWHNRTPKIIFLSLFRSEENGYRWAKLGFNGLFVNLCLPCQSTQGLLQLPGKNQINHQPTSVMKKIFFLTLLSASQLFASAQNVGIGTSNPLRAKLEVHGAVDATSAIFGGESSGVSIQRNWPGIGFNTYHNGVHRYLANGYGSVLALDPANGFMVLDMFASGTANNNIIFPYRAMVVNNLGWMNVGSADAPATTLQVARGSAADGTAMLKGTTHASYFNKGANENTYIRAGLDNGTVYINDVPGGRTVLFNTGINGANVWDHPLEIFQANNSTKALLINHQLGRWGLGVTSGNLTLKRNESYKGEFSATDGTYSSASDARLKTAVSSLVPVLPKLLQLRPVNFEMCNDNPSHQKSIGFIAQDVKRLFPELVTVISDTSHGYKNISDLHTLNYSGFSVLAIKAIQEQQAMIEALRKELDDLKEAIKEIKK